MARMSIIEMTIISSSSVKPRSLREKLKGKRQKAKEGGRTLPLTPLRFCLLPFAFCLLPLPVTVLLPVERFTVGLRAHVEEVGGACGAALVRRVVARKHAPLGLARYRVYGNLAQVALLLRDEAGVVCRLPAALDESPARLRAGQARARHNVHAVNQSLQVGRVVFGVVNAEYLAVGDDDAAARVNINAALPVLPVLSVRRNDWLSVRRNDCAARPALHPDRVSLELVNGIAHLAQDFVQSLLLLASHGSPHYRYDGERQNRQNRHRDDEFDERPAAGGRTNKG